MSRGTDYLKFIEELQLSRLGDATDAGLCITSLPWPRSAPLELALDGRPTYCKPLGQWPGEPEPTPRRLLLVADSGGSTPEQLSLSPQTIATGQAPPSAEFELFERSKEAAFVWERHLLRLRWGNKSVGLAMGL